MAGDVIQYAFLWPDHSDLGRETDKDRPCGVVLSAPHGVDLIVFVVPLTTKDPHDQRAIELPEGGELGLKSRSWIIPWELNTFQWPSPDVGHAPSPKGAFWRYGQLSRSIRQRVADTVAAEVRAGRLRSVRREE